jgi:hypothetical protein
MITRFTLYALRSTFPCDPALHPFYERLGMRPWSGMVVRNYDRQSGDAPPGERMNMPPQ